MYNDTAKNITQMLNTIYVDKHEIVKAELKDFSNVNQNFYISQERNLEEMDFKWVADYEDVTLSNVNQESRTIVRVMLNIKKNIAAFIYSIFNFEKKILENILDFTSFLENGMVVSTLNTLSLTKMTHSPKTIKNFMESDTPMPDQLKEHLKQCFITSEKHETTMLEIRESFDDIINCVNHVNNLEAEYRNGIPGKILYDELLYAFEFDEHTAMTIHKLILQTTENKE